MSFISKLAAGVEGFASGVQAGQSLGYNIAGGPAQELQRKREREDAQTKRARRNEIEGLINTDPETGIATAEAEGFTDLAAAGRAQINRRSSIARAGISPAPTTIGTGGAADFTAEGLGQRRAGLLATQRGMDAYVAEFGTSPDITAQQQQIVNRLNFIENLTQSVSNLSTATNYGEFANQQERTKLLLEDQFPNDPDLVRVAMKNYEKNFDAFRRNELLAIMQGEGVIAPDSYIPANFKSIVDEYSKRRARDTARGELAAFTNIVTTASLLKDPESVNAYVGKNAAALGLDEDTAKKITEIAIKEITTRDSLAKRDALKEIEAIVQRDLTNFFTNYTTTDAIQSLAASYGVTLEYGDTKSTGGIQIIPTMESKIRLADAMLSAEGVNTPVRADVDSVQVATPDKLNRIEYGLDQLSNDPERKVDYDKKKEMIKTEFTRIFADPEVGEEEKSRIESIAKKHDMDIYPTRAREAARNAQTAILGGNMVGGFEGLFGGLFGGPKQNLAKPPQASASPPPNRDNRIATGKPN